MTLSLRSITSPERPVVGSGPGGRVEITDIRAKLEELRGEADQTATAARPLGLRDRPQAGPPQVHLGGSPAPVSKAWRWLVQQGLRRGWQQGLLDGNRAWIVIGGAALLAHLFGRYGGRQEELIFSEVIEPGDVIRIVNEPADS
jgi:hypothetical protein